MRASIVVPSYGRPDAIRRCVAALQHQDARDIEIVVVDDGSPEPVSDLPEGPHPLRLIRQENAGPAAARNRGARAAGGDLLCLTDDDCTPDPHWVSAFLAAAEARPVLMGGLTRNAVAGSRFSAASQDMADHLSRLAEGEAPFFPSNNMAVARAAFLEVGGFETGYALAAGEDRAFCRTWAAAGHRFASVPEATLAHHHALSLRTFWRQHRAYGHGAHRFHATGCSAGARPLERLGFYAGLLGAPLRGGLSADALIRSGLIGLAQFATIAGYRDAARADRRRRPSPDGSKPRR